MLADAKIVVFNRNEFIIQQGILNTKMYMIQVTCGVCVCGYAAQFGVCGDVRAAVCGVSKQGSSFE